MVDDSSAEPTTPDPGGPAPSMESAGVDPLIAHPRQSSGHTGEVPRPGDETPVWFVPALFVVFAAFIAGLVVIGQTDRGEPTEAESQTPVPSTEPVDQVPDGTGSRSDAVASGGGVGVAAIDELPPVGSLRIGTEVYPIAARCEVHVPLAPVDTDRQVSSYVFVDGSGTPQLIDRVFDDGGDTAFYDGAGDRFVSIADVGDSGAFTATFVDSAGGPIVISVNPGTNDGGTCDDRLVTNEPGQFAEPHTWIVLDVCTSTAGAEADAPFVAGLTSEGGRFSVRRSDGGSSEIRFRAPSLAGGAPLTDTAAEVIVDTDTFSASGFVTGSGIELDITVDIASPDRDERRCTETDRV